MCEIWDDACAVTLLGNGKCIMRNNTQAILRHIQLYIDIKQMLYIMDIFVLYGTSNEYL